MMGEQEKQDLLKLEGDIRNYLDRVMADGIPPVVEEFMGRLHEIAVR